MKLASLSLFVSGLLLAGDWSAVQRIPAAAKIEITERNGHSRARANMVSASPSTIVVRETSGERSIAQTEVFELKVFDFRRKVHRGLMWTIIGAGVGAGASLAACAPCSGEGHDMAKYLPLGVGGGAAVGALGFFSPPYRTVYKAVNVWIGLLSSKLATSLRCVNTARMPSAPPRKAGSALDSHPGEGATHDRLTGN